MIDLRFHKPLISCFVYGNAILQAAISKIPHQMHRQVLPRGQREQA